MKNLILLIIILFSGCGYHRHYVKVVTDPHRSDRDKKLLLQACNDVAPSKPPEYIKGKDSIRVDTFNQVNITYRNDTVFIETEKTIYKDHFRVDTFKVDNPARIKQLEDVIREGNKLNDAQANQITSFEAEVKEKDSTISKLHFRQWFGWIVLVISFAVWLVNKFKK